MIRKSISLFVIAAILFSLFPGAALAVSGTISVDGTYDIGSYGNNSVITIQDGHVVTLTNTGGLTLTNVQINCGYGTTLTIDGIKIDNSANAGVCALSFTQYHNKLILVGDSYIKSGNNMPGIKEDSSSELEISGEGSIEVYGGTNAAGIGGTYQSAEMVTTISGGTVKATGGSHGAGIGGGDSNQDLMVIINGGSVTAQGGDGGAGIGGGYNSAGGVVIEINGGDVNSVGGAGGAGIGGGYNGHGGESTIQGDCTVRAFGGLNAAGIGGGQGKPGGTLGVSGGLVLAEGNGGYDIGCGAGGTPDEYDIFNISENAAVLLRNGTCTEPTTLYHELKVQDPVTNHTAFGFNLPDSWTKAYAYLKVYYDLTYDANGGQGTLPETIRQHEGTSIAVADGDGLTKEEDVFCKWNTQPNGLGLDYKPGDLYNFSENITLYAIYTVHVHVSSVTLDKENADIIDGDTLKLNATVLPVNTTYHDIEWTSSNEDVAAVDGNGNVTAIYPGTATITALVDGISDTCDITVKPKRVTSVTLSSHSETMEEEDTITLTATVLPDNATYPRVIWSSDHESVATIDQSGVITAAEAGTAMITATADGVSDSCQIKVDVKSYTVLFDMQYAGAENPTVKVNKNTVVTEPQQPERSGYAFIGWFREQSCINEWDFSDDVVTDNITLYALWKKDGTPFSGCGTQTNPYRITNGAELANLSALVNAGNTDYIDKYYIQAQDIDLSAYANWTPIGTEVTGRMFAGSYDGNGNSITNLNITNSSVYTGLFGYLSGTVKNLTVENGRISINSENATAGTIVGCVFNGAIQNCHVKTSSINASNSSGLKIGGIAGSITASVISGCSFNGTISITGFGVDSGGIAGDMSGSAATGSVIEDCISAGSISADMTSYSFIGGITGSTNLNAVSSSIERCSNSLAIQSQGDFRSYCGGISGYTASADISDCYNAANIISEPKKAGHGAGGLTGYYYGRNSTFNNCYNIGGVQSYYCGGIVGLNIDPSAVITNCYYLNTCSLAVGDGKGTANRRSSDELKLQSTYSGFDFSSVWTMDEAEETGYPYPQLKTGLFYPQPHEVTLTADDTMESLQGTGAYKPFETVTITALPKEHYVFKNWVVSSGVPFIDNTGSPTATFSMPTWDVSITAISEKKKYNVAFEYDGSGTASGGGPYTWGDTVSIAAAGKDGDQFLYWDVVSGDAVVSDKFDMTTTFVMPKSNVTLKAVFGENPTEFTYTIADEKATITGYTGTGGEVKIPARIGGYWVTAIGDWAFLNCNSFTRIEIPDCVKRIGDSAFSNCTKMSEVYIGAGVESIGRFPFNRCYALTEIDVSESNANYCSADGVLYNKDKTELVAYPPGRLGSFSIPQGVTSIAPAAFSNCVLLTGISIPDSVTLIGQYAFTNTEIGSVSIPRNVNNIQDYAFNSCSSLQNVVFGENVKSIGEYAFSGCGKISRLYLPETLTAINNKAFANCGQLTHVYFWGSRPDVFADNAFEKSDNYNIYYHVSKAGSWVAASGRAFCVLTLEQGEDLGKVTQNAILDAFKLVKPADPTRKNYAFAGWYADSECNVPYNFDNTVTHDITLYAKWTPNTYTITFNSKEGSYVPPVNAQYGSLITEPAAPTRPGYSFSGWYKESSCVNGWNFGAETVKEDRTLYAKWDPQKFIISYDLGGGSLNSPNPEYYMTDGGAITLHNPAKTGHTFSGWSGTGISGVLATVTIPSGSMGDRHYAANWTPNTYTITFNPKEGNSVAAVSAQYGSLIPEPAPPFRPGYSFAGWYKEASCISRWNFQTDTVTVSDTLYAKWQPFSCLLDHVELSAGTLMKPFAKNTASYNITLGEYEESITLTPVKEYDGALMKINNAVRNSITLSVAGGKSATVKVSVGFDKKTKNYTFKITRAKSSNNALSSLYATAGSFDRPFDPNVLNYTLKLDENTKSVTIKAASASGAGVSPASKTLTLNNGAAKTVKITVKAQTGAKRTYTITVIRTSASNADLKMLKAPGLSPGFSPGTTNYTVMLPVNKGVFSVSAKAAGYKAAVYIDGVKKASKKVTLSSGQSITVCVTVVAQAGNTKDYYITVMRP